MASESPEHKRCLGCGYIIDYLPEPRCPECGREFDPQNPLTFQPPPEPGRPLRRFGAVGFAILALSAAFIVLLQPHGRDVLSLLVCPGIVTIPGAIMALVAIIASWQGVRARSELISDRRDYLVALLSGVIGLVLVGAAVSWCLL